MRGSPWLLVVLLVTPPSLARADRNAQRTAVAAVGGLGTPVGGLGVELEHRLDDRLWLGGGLGIGLEGTQVAVMPRYEIGERAARLAFGLGISGGAYRWREGWGWCFSTDCAERSSDLAVWANAEVALVVRTDGGFRLRAFAGYGFMLNPGSLECPPIDPTYDDDGAAQHCHDDHSEDGERLPSIGLSLGYAF